MHVYLLDGTYELFRYHAVVPSSKSADGAEVGALRGVVGSVIGMLEGFIVSMNAPAGAAEAVNERVTHLGVATDHVIESFRNDLWPGYKTGAGVPAELLEQFQPLEDALRLLGVVVWPMTEFEADDALAAAAAKAAADPRVERVIIATPDKDLAQCVDDVRVVQLERRTGRVIDEEGVAGKFGVLPESIPDYLALVGDSADGFPGLPGWGAKSTAAVLARYRHLEAIPDSAGDWDLTLRGADRLGEALIEGRDDARLFRDLATLRTQIPVFDDVDELRWRGPEPGFRAWCEHVRAPRLADRVDALVAAGPAEAG
jgi:5'-3' exonuclease